ncbi:DUF4145 domain-containing protein [Pontivivens ytuae]|uniref:DUF4145 domain-containing protein n=2 Tax=Pontivivens ytuae TaxID=2789856 RepID=A0A7S9LW62_9RHOB|nr:DUF4145 domain-containing protein [Pontivivens ytuae]
MSSCYHCSKISIWVNDKLVYPIANTAPLPNPDLPKDILDLYKEAASILNSSPRGAAALLRLAIQMLCKELGEEGSNINKDIGSLVSKGMPQDVQRALDAVRVIGNNAVHPGKIDFSDDNEIAITLFKLINIITEKTISEPKQINDIYNSLPQSALEGIKQRDMK